MPVEFLLSFPQGIEIISSRSTHCMLSGGTFLRHFLDGGFDQFLQSQGLDVLAIFEAPRLCEIKGIVTYFNAAACGLVYVVLVALKFNGSPLADLPVFPQQKEAIEPLKVINPAMAVGKSFLKPCG